MTVFGGARFRPAGGKDHGAVFQIPDLTIFRFQPGGKASDLSETAGQPAIEMNGDLGVLFDPSPVVFQQRFGGVAFEGAANPGQVAPDLQVALSSSFWH